MFFNIKKKGWQARRTVRLRGRNLLKKKSQKRSLKKEGAAFLSRPAHKKNTVHWSPPPPLGVDTFFALSLALHRQAQKSSARLQKAARQKKQENRTMPAATVPGARLSAAGVRSYARARPPFPLLIQPASPLSARRARFVADA
jgi:hypothetical protein